MAVIIPVQADDTQFLAAMAGIESSAIKAGSSVSTSIGNGMRAAANSTSKAVDSLGEMKDAASDAGSSAGKIGGLLSTVSAPAAKAAKNVGDIADAAEVATAAVKAIGTKGFTGLLATIGPLGAIIGVATAAFTAYQASAEAAASASKAAKESNERLTDSYKSLSEQLYDATIQQRVLSGALTETQGASLKAGANIAKTFGPALSESAQRLAAAKKAVADYRAELGKGEGSTSSVRAKMKELTDAADAAEKSFNELRAKYAELTSVTKANVVAEGEHKESLDATAEAAKNGKKEASEFLAAWRKIIDAMDEDTAATASATDLIKQLTDASRESYVSTLKGEAEVTAKLEDKLKTLESVYQQAVRNATSDAQIVEANAAYENAKVEAVKAAESEKAEIRQKTAEDQAKAADEAKKAAEKSGMDQLKALQGGLSGIVGYAYGPIAGELTSMFLGVVDKFKNAAKSAFSAVTSTVSKVMSAIGFDISSIMKAASSEDGPKAAIKEMADQAKSFIKNLPSAIKAFTAELPGVINGLVAGIPDIVDAIVNALPIVVGAIVGALPELFAAIKSSLPKLVKSVVDLLPVLILGIIKELPGLVKMLTKQIPILVDGLLAALPDILMAIFDALPDIIVALLKMINPLIIAIVKNLPAIIKALVVGIFKMAIMLLVTIWKPVIEVLGKIIKWVADKVKAYFIALKDAVVFFFQKWIDMWKETLTLGRADTSLDDRKDRRSYGDSPGIVRAGPQGMTVQASPGDYVNIGRNRQQLLDRALSGSGVAQPPAAVAPQPVLVLTEHTRQFDWMGYKLTRMGGRMVDISNRTTKNARGR